MLSDELYFCGLIAPVREHSSHVGCWQLRICKRSPSERVLDNVMLRCWHKSVASEERGRRQDAELELSDIRSMSGLGIRSDAPLSPI